MSASEELSRASAGVFDAETEATRLAALLDAMQKSGKVANDLLDECPELTDAVARNEKLKYRKKTLERSLAEQRTAGPSSSAAKIAMSSGEVDGKANDKANGTADQPSPDVLRRRDLITRNLQEVLGQDKLTQQLTAGKNIHVYWGTATTGRPHVGYLVPMQKIADFLLSGIKVTVLFADLHAFLDNMKSTWELLENRVKYYETSIKALLSSLGVPIEQLHFVRGSTYQLSRPYTEDILKLCAQVSQRDALKAGAEVVKQVASPLLSGLLYPLLQALDEQYLKVDGQFGGVDQRKIFILAEEQLPKLKLGKRWHLMNPMVPGLTGGKMSSSELDSKIDLLDDAAVVTRKIAGAACERGADDNGVLSFYEYVLMPIVSPAPITIGGKDFSTAAEVREAFEGGVIGEEQLKEKLTEFLNDLLAKVQTACSRPEVKEALEKGYAAAPDIDEKKQLPPRAVPMLNGNASIHLEAFLRDAKLVASDSSSLSIALSEGRTPRILISLAPKGKFHLGLLVPLLRIRSLVRTGVPIHATILISTLEAFLDAEKCPWAARDGRAAYFAAIIGAFVKGLCIAEHVDIVKDTELEGYLSSEFTLEFYKLASAVTRDEASVLSSATSALACSLVPLIYALYAKYSKVDAILIGEDAMPIAELAVKLFRSLGLAAPTQIALPLVPGMDESKMGCSSSEDALLDPLDTTKQTAKKIGRSFCEPGNATRNIALDLAAKVVFPLLDGQPLTITRSPENGGDVSCVDHAALAKEVAGGSLHPADLKQAIVAQINALFDPVRSALESQSNLIKAAFPKVQGKKK